MTQKIIAIIQARMGSSRLPEKVLMPLGDKAVLEWVVHAAQKISGVDQVVVATSDNSKDDAVAGWCKKQDIDCFRGSEEDVLSRYYEAAQTFGATHIIRLTGDCPLLDPSVCSSVLWKCLSLGADYCSNTLLASWPDGLDCEVFTFAALEKAHCQATKSIDREHVTHYIYTNRHLFDCHHMPCPIPHLHKERWTLDTQEDYAFLSKVVNHLEHDGPYAFTDILQLLSQHEDWREINSLHKRNEALKPKDVAITPSDSFHNSTAFLERAEASIPVGSQTFSKSRTQWPVGAAPLFATHGVGGRVWDIDGNAYVDLVSALLPNILGYCDPDIDEAIREQLNRGISLSLATTLEAELAEELIKLIPCAEMVRFGKNGSDVTSAAIRLARAYTGRNHIINCGYHGWHDWHIGSTTMHLGIPKEVSALTHPVAYNNIEAVEELITKYDGQIAALIMEPMNVAEPKEGYFEALQALLRKHGILLIFDEIITGFRFANGGAQELFGVTPDLATFGKAMANGMPLSALVGRKDIMQLLEKIFFSGTFGGETLSLAASLALVKKVKNEPVIEQIWKRGASIKQKAEKIVAAHGLSDIIQFVGKAPWVLLSLKPHSSADVNTIKTAFIHHMARHGVLTLGAHNICYAHNEHDSAHILAAYEAVMKIMEQELSQGSLAKNLPCEVITPLFKVREI